MLDWEGPWTGRGAGLEGGRWKTRRSTRQSLAGGSNQHSIGLAGSVSE